VPTRVLPALRRRGFRVHRVGAAAYIHDGELHVIAGAWNGRAPTWAPRLGDVSDGYRRRLERCERRQVGRWMVRDRLGRFFRRRSWWQVPGALVYRHEPRRPSLRELGWGPR
jgi:hypothetical protein